MSAVGPVVAYQRGTDTMMPRSPDPAFAADTDGRIAAAPLGAAPPFRESRFAPDAGHRE
ncbi:MAG TPA: hypothetical protein VMU82_11785 [Acetobacteraceae bacterium]|nr:hypothetical protein [Acetobacteraceae bacterium]